ncbi:MAG: YHS domain protein [Chitinophagia bacterium]|nr:YHS domain protein [Chitinophagia bacterium]
MILRQLFVWGLLLLGTATSVLGQETAASRQKQYNLEHGLAIQGYDPVSYFAGKPQRGDAKLAYSYNGVTYRFATAANLETFKKNPAGYEPQYGGWCAYAMGNTGEKVEINPETYKIINGKLYLYYNHLFTNTLKSWNKDEAHLKPNADNNWKKIQAGN